MKKSYEDPRMQIVRLTGDDVICSSGGVNPTPYPGSTGDGGGNGDWSDPQSLGI